MLPLSAPYRIMKLKLSTMASHSYTLLDVHKDIQQGYKYSCAQAVADRLELNDQELADALGVSLRTLQRIPDKDSLMSPQMSDRLFRLASIVALAEYVLEDVAVAHQWLRESQRGLGGHQPLAIIGSQAGYREVESLLGRIEHGVYS